MSEEIQNKTVFADALRASVRMYEQAHNFADQLDKLAGLEGQEKELLVKIERLKEGEQKAIEAKAVAVAEYDEYVEKANADLAELERKGEELTANARAEAAEKLNKAQESAKLVEDAAQAEAKKIKQSGLDDLMNYNKQVADAKDYLVKINQDIEKAKQDLAEHEAMIGQLKGKLKELLGDK